MKQLAGLRLDIGYTIEDIRQEIVSKTKCKLSSIGKIEILKESIDCRRKPIIIYNLNVAFEVLSEDKKFEKLPDIEVNHNGIEENFLDIRSQRPVIVGFGPAGMFMGLKLAKSGLKPIIIEQGDSVEERKEKIDKFWTTGKLDVYSNVHFGEGGAGTFSDGKLNSNINNEYCKIVTNELIEMGAPKEIFYKSKPHIGTDNLTQVVRNIRNEIIRLGGEVYFKTKLIDFETKDNKIASVLLYNVDTKEEKKIDTDTLILAVGHSARSVFTLLKNKNVEMEQKPFAMGVRIEQKQSDINMSQYGVLDSRLPSADYKLVEHLDNGRSVFTFCMCPGGEVVASTSEENTIVTNGMSYFARDKENANSALLVNVVPEDFGSSDVLAGIDFQTKYERLAFELGGNNYFAPAETVGSFLSGKETNPINATYRPGVKYCKIEKCLPDFVAKSLKLALPKFERKIKNFANEKNVLTAIESRSSCPVRILRNENCMTNICGLFAIGEGAGYAGGIMSSAQDGLKVADYVIKYLGELE